MLLASLNAFSTNSIDYKHFLQDLNPRNYDYLQADQNKHALFLEEPTVTSVQIDSEDFSGTFSFGIFFQNAPLTILQRKASISITPANQDLKYFLEQQIFPFHFFW